MKIGLSKRDVLGGMSDLKSEEMADTEGLELPIA